MYHCILVKFIKDYNYLNQLDNIKSIFNSIKINGIKNIDYKINCVNKDNRYDLMIIINMDKNSLEEYINCKPHKLWKDTYSKYIDKKAIFDYE